MLIGRMIEHLAPVLALLRSLRLILLVLPLALLWGLLQRLLLVAEATSLLLGVLLMLLFLGGTNLVNLIPQVDPARTLVLALLFVNRTTLASISSLTAVVRTLYSIARATSPMVASTMSIAYLAFSLLVLRAFSFVGGDARLVADRSMEVIIGVLLLLLLREITTSFVRWLLLVLLVLPESSLLRISVVLALSLGVALGLL
mmetsp:Transcript_41450/g.63243  ORF Transcript_41450/g.63243 Transcript_41450/m.63243 type:complete len:201 (-) Transcript_41450:2065-2667(-)